MRGCCTQGDVKSDQSHHRGCPTNINWNTQTHTLMSLHHHHNSSSFPMCFRVARFLMAAPLLYSTDISRPQSVCPSVSLLPFCPCWRMACFLEMDGCSSNTSTTPCCLPAAVDGVGIISDASEKCQASVSLRLHSLKCSFLHTTTFERHPQYKAGAQK